MHEVEREVSWEGSLADWQEALDLARAAEDADLRDPEQRIAEQVAAVFAAFETATPPWWKAVEAVAFELLKWREMSGSDVIQVIRSVLDE